MIAKFLQVTRAASRPMQPLRQYKTPYWPMSPDNLYFTQSYFFVWIVIDMLSNDIAATNLKSSTCGSALFVSLPLKV
jgi:hypothetical protein